MLSRRADVSRLVGGLKQDDGCRVHTPAREAEILDRLTRLSSRAGPDHLRAIYRESLSVSRDLQRTPRIAFLGPKATYGHQAALQRFGSAAEYVPAATNPGVVDEVERGAADYGVIPIENSAAGPVIIGDIKPIERDRFAVEGVGPDRLAVRGPESLPSS